MKHRATTILKVSARSRSNKMGSIRELYEKSGQSALFEHWDRLSDAQKREFERNLEATAAKNAPEKLVGDCKRAIELSSGDSDDVGAIKPLPSGSYESTLGEPAVEQEYRDLGLRELAEGRVAVILMAGGQGTRLGSSQPKGCYDIQLPSAKSLFQIQAEKLLRLQELVKTPAPIPWYIMTSKPTRQSTEQFFQDHEYFGLSKHQITFFNQGTLPAFDLKGENLLLNSPTELVESPDGNGGLYRAIKDNGILEDMVAKNIRHIHMYCVDNVLVKLADPVFIGFALKNKFELATKAVRKRDASESVGLIASKHGAPCVVEYSEISKEMAEATDKEGLLKFRAANIVNHYYSVNLLQRELEAWCESMPYHIAKKKIPVYNNKTESYLKPTEPNGIKLEQFIFDVFPKVAMDKFGCLEVDRSSEFSPLKNAPGTANDNPETSRAAYLNLGTSWLEHAGAKVASGVLIEVPGKISYGGEHLESYKGQSFNENLTILH
ncbi:LANO_0G09340g1_1 [Lachancea nothofagi CBS 11611]|uniref:UDP-N-acetylglucosamine diphosphorylase n=1 Tax=Lachancea nothofagi CBS 11611 TaxID=1266666 RepID=A0A1G4KIB3_9SACH|nr:LANO_0G09340g1_1 [Lachancea nothofagi CBS 11611]